MMSSYFFSFYSFDLVSFDQNDEEAEAEEEEEIKRGPYCNRGGSLPDNDGNVWRHRNLLDRPQRRTTTESIDLSMILAYANTERVLIYIKFNRIDDNCATPLSSCVCVCVSCVCECVSIWTLFVCFIHFGVSFLITRHWSSTSRRVWFQHYKIHFESDWLFSLSLFVCLGEH